jgi:signal transduction protein with GAF and PtsI domain
MARQGQDQQKLDQVVELVSKTMVADVCSIYLSYED